MIIGVLQGLDLSMAALLSPTVTNRDGTTCSGGRNKAAQDPQVNSGKIRRQRREPTIQ